mmetsp:Transcript_3030/g.6834  ORF Transcript_3030/g.6834 Transcript_3030/m.6834 type:complete len:94 (+) Transcript_3030:324-605(+)
MQTVPDFLDHQQRGSQQATPVSSYLVEKQYDFHELQVACSLQPLENDDADGDRPSWTDEQKQEEQEVVVEQRLAVAAEAEAETEPEAEAAVRP